MGMHGCRVDRRQVDDDVRVSTQFEIAVMTPDAAIEKSPPKALLAGSSHIRPRLRGCAEQLAVIRRRSSRTGPGDAAASGRSSPKQKP